MKCASCQNVWSGQNSYCRRQPNLPVRRVALLPSQYRSSCQAQAVVFAEKAVAATNRKNPAHLDTLAASYAEVGQFEKAVSTEQEAIALLQTEAEKNDYRRRVKLFEAKAPYRAKD